MIGRAVAGMCVGAASIIGAGLLSAQPVDAQEILPGFKIPEFEYHEDNWYLTLGLGAKIEPTFPGADRYQGMPYLVINLAKGKELYDFQSVDDSSSLTFFDVKGFSGGAAWALNTGRDEDEGSKLAGLGDVKATFEAGGFLQWFPVPWFRTRGEFLYGMGGFDGWVANVGADFIAAEGPWRFSLGPRLFFAGSGYMDAFYGVTPTQSAVATYFVNPLPTYQPSSGLASWGVTGQVTRYMGNGFTWGMYGSYDRLVGDASSSPLTQNTNQFEAGMSISYAFNLGKAWW